MSSNVGGDGAMPADGGADASAYYDVYSAGFWAKVLLNGTLVAIITYLLMKIVMRPNAPRAEKSEDAALPKMKKRDFTIQELREFDGTKGDGRILVAINGKVFDVTKGKHFYGPGGVYSTFGGHDASRGLATFSVSGKDEYDDLSDLNSLELESMLEWESQFMEKYDYVGHLLKPGESHSYYTDEEETPSNKLHLENPKQSGQLLNNTENNCSDEEIDSPVSEDNKCNSNDSRQSSDVPDVIKSSDDTLEK